MSAVRELISTNARDQKALPRTSQPTLPGDVHPSRVLRYASYRLLSRGKKYRCRRDNLAGSFNFRRYVTRSSVHFDVVPGCAHVIDGVH